MRSTVAMLATMGAFVAVATAALAQEQGARILHRMNPHGMGLAAPTGGTSSTSAIINHGGPVIGTPTIYIVWYGNWNQSNGSDNATGQNIVREFASYIGSSPHFNINTSYPGVTGSVVFGGETSDNYSRGNRLKDADVKTIVVNAISKGGLPYDANGVYFVLSSSDITNFRPRMARGPT